jgi:hypothetical protein
MVRVGVIAVALVVALGRPAAAEVRDAVYRGTMVCDKLPFMRSQMRGAIEVTISGGTAHYKNVVRPQDQPEITVEQGSGTIKGQDIALQGAWDGGSRRYKADYIGTFVRRSAHLKGTQVWSVAGKDVTRNCSASIKRPFKVFLPRQKKS